MKVYKFDPILYPRLIWIAVGTEAPKEFTNLSDFPDSTLAVVSDTYSTKQKRHGFLIRFRDTATMTVATISHESFHVAMNIFNYIDSNVNEETSECFAYLLGWIANCCNEVKMINDYESKN